MRILHLIDSSGMYGAEIMMINLMAEQKAMGDSPMLLSMGRTDEKEKLIEIEGRKNELPVYKIRIGNNLRVLYNIELLKRMIDELNVDIVHSHGYKGNILLGMIPRKKREFPVISTLHGWTATKRFSKLWIYEKLDKKCIQRFEALVLVTDARYGKCSTIQYVTEKSKMKVFLIENGIPELSFESKDKEDNLHPLLKKHNGFIIGAIGRLSSEKGFGYLVDAMAYLQKESIVYKLVVLGEGPERPHLETKAKELCLQENIFFAGYRKNAYRYMKQFDLLVMPSLTEGLPITLLEAMQAGLPIIASDVGGIPEVITDGYSGILVNPKDSNALAKKISYIKNNPQKGCEIGMMARHIALNKYSSRTMAQKYKRVYFEVLC